MIRPGQKYEMRQERAAAQLIIRDVEQKDAGDYTCVCGERWSSAVLMVNGNGAILISLLYYLLLSQLHFFMHILVIIGILDRSVCAFLDSS